MDKFNNVSLGWLSPNAELIECSSYDHISTAREICEKYNYEITCAPDDVLINNGWVHIGISSFSAEYQIWWKNFLTDYQINFLKPYFESDRIDFMCLCKWERLMDNR